MSRRSTEIVLLLTLKQTAPSDEVWPLLRVSIGNRSLFRGVPEKHPRTEWLRSVTDTIEASRHRPS